MSTLTRRGWSGAGGGSIHYVPTLPQRRGATTVIQGLYPWIGGAAVPLQGVPVGHTIRDDDSPGVTLPCDPLTWFESLHLILNPSAFILGLPHTGKSTLIRRWIAVLSAWGVLPFVLGDVKGEYVDIIRALGGQVISLGRGRGTLNPLDMGAAPAAADRIGGDAGKALLADASARRLLSVESLLSIQRGTASTDHETLLMTLALDTLDNHPARGVPLLTDLLGVFAEAPQALKDAALWRDDIDRYYEATDALRKSLAGLTLGSGFGNVFAQNTTTPLELDSPAVFDLSGVDRGDTKLRAALQLGTWAYGFGQIAVAQALFTAGLTDHQPRYMAVQDELWSALRMGPGLVDKVDEAGRLNREDGLVTVRCSHTMEDANALPDADRAKARGLVERSGMIITGPLPPSEHALLRSVARYSDRELDRLSSWATPRTWGAMATDDDTVTYDGQGNFGVKAGERPMLAFHLDLVPSERPVNRTNKKWAIA